MSLAPPVSSPLSLALGQEVDTLPLVRDSYFIAEQPAPAHPEGCAALRIVRRVCRSFECFPDAFDPQLLYRVEGRGH